MIAEIISIGTELLLGQIVDTNSTYLAEHLTALGFDIHYTTNVGDNKERLVSVLEQAMDRADLIVTTGGLGPTEDDITRMALAEAADRELYKDRELVDDIKKYFHQKGYTMTDNNNRQAYLPSGAEPIKNDWGTAPAIKLDADDYLVISLPGVPAEMKNILQIKVLPQLQELTGEYIASKTLRFFGIGESTLETKVKDILQKQDNPTMALLAGRGEVKIRITAKGDSKEKTNDLIEKKEAQIREKVGKFIYGTENTDLSETVGKELTKKGFTVGLAESCTGGLVGHRITSIPGSSTYFKGSMVVYSNQAKVEQLGVDADIIEEDGAVSRSTASAMAESVREKLKTDIGLSLTGIAGPGGGTEEKPVGLVYIGLANGKKTKTFKLNLKGEREFNKWMSSQYGLYYLLKMIKNEEGVNK